MLETPFPDYRPHLTLAHQYWKSWLQPHDCVIDATCGNGKDTQFLATLVPEGRVYAMDIQIEALENAKKYVKATNVVFLLQSHTHFPLIEPVKLVVYNLGYLPGGDKSVTTLSETTLVSVAQVVGIAQAVCITCYPGHAEGRKETEQLFGWVKRLDAQQWAVSTHQWRPKAPVLLFIRRIQ